MKGHNSNKKEKISATLMTGIILAGVMTGSIVNVVNGVGQGTSVQAKELNETVNPQTASSEKITEKSTSIKTTKEVANKKEATKATTKKDIKETARKTKSAVPAAGYVGPSTGAIKTDWDTKDWASASATAFVSPSGSQSKPDEPVLYFGNSTFKFQPSALTNNKSYSPLDGGNKSSWAYIGKAGINPNPRKSYGIIINNSVPKDRGYGLSSAGTGSSPGSTLSIEGALQNDQVNMTDYHLYKNKAGTGFKAIMYDNSYKLSYTFEEMYDADGGIYSYFSITNNDTTSRAIGAVEGVDTYVDNDAVPVLSLGPDNGFKMVGDAKPLAHTLNFKLKDPKTGAKLGGWTNYTAGTANSINKYANVTDYFTGGILGAGMEKSVLNKEIGVINISNPDTPLSSLESTSNDIDSGFVIKANPKMLAQGETLTTGSYLTYKETTPTIPPVATVTPATINAYADQTDALKIEGTVKDEDGTKGNIQITYPDGSTTVKSYDTISSDTELTYTAAIDPTKLKVGANKLTIMAIDDKDNEQTTPVTVTVNLFKMGATAIPQQIDVGGTVTTDETKLIKDLTIMNTNKHTLEIDPTNPSNKPLDNTKVGFYMQDMILTDTDVTPNETAKVAVPVNVIDGDTVVDGDSVVYAKDFSTDSKAISGLTETELKDFILKESSAKGWVLSTGADSKVTVKSTTLTPTSSASDYEAVIVNAQGVEKTIKITVAGGGLAITAASDEMTFGSKTGVMLPYSGENFNLQRNAENTVSISNLGKTAWTLKASISKPLTDGSNTLKGVLKYVDAAGTHDLDTGSTEVGSGHTEETKDVTWAADKGVVAELNGSNTSLKAGKYAGEITWTLTDAP